MIELHALFVVVLVGSEAFFTWLAVLNVRHGAQAVERETEWFDEQLDVEDTDELLDYQRATTGAAQLETWVGLALILLVLYSGLFADAVGAVESLGLRTAATGVVFFLGVVAALQISSIPFDLFDTFVVEEIFEFNEQTPRLWLRDLVVGLAISLVFAGVLAGGVMLAVVTFPDLWWVAAWGLYIAFSLVMLVVYPRVIAPLFNDFDPVEEGDLHDAVTEVFDRAGFSCSGIYVMDASRRSSHSNAYFVGFGRAKRVVLFDTLVEQMDREAIQAVLAHELAHWKQSHIWKQLGASAVQMAVVFAFLWWVTTSQWVYAAFGLPSEVYAALGIGLLYAGPVLTLTAPLTNRLSLSHEREADDFAAETMGEASSMTRALETLAGENLSNPFPHPAYAAFHLTHPPIPERIRRLRERYADGGNDGGAGDDRD